MRYAGIGALLTLASAAAALAQSAPTRPIPLDSLEPRPGVVQERERAAGLTPSAQENRAEQQDVDKLYRELTGSSPTAPAPAAPLGPPMRTEAAEENRLYRDLTGSNPGAPAR